MKEMLEQLLQENEALQFALDSYPGQISIHCPAHNFFHLEFKLFLKEKLSRKPLKALTVFTDVSRASHRSVVTWKDTQIQQWESDIKEVDGSPQIAELATVNRAFERFSKPFNLITDFVYVAGLVFREKKFSFKRDLKPKPLQLALETNPSDLPQRVTILCDACEVTH